jgi:FdhE protein
MSLTELRRKPADVPEPSWQRWTDLVVLAVAESQNPAWHDVVRVSQRRLPDAPLLHGATLRISTDAATALVRRTAESLGILCLEAIDPVLVLRSGIERRQEITDALAAALAVSSDTVAVLGQLSSSPLLLNAARRLDPELSKTWQHRYCPVCGAWPSMVEMRGIQRERHLCCGCCGGDWVLPVLRCAFCDETDHNKLGSLSSEGGHQVRVETCSTCRGYLKSVTTLGALPFAALAAKDLSTVAFDLAAQDRGYARPQRLAWQLDVEIIRC